MWLCLSGHPGGSFSEGKSTMAVSSSSGSTHCLALSWSGLNANNGHHWTGQINILTILSPIFAASKDQRPDLCRFLGLSRLSQQNETYATRCHQSSRTWHLPWQCLRALRGDMVKMLGVAFYFRSLSCFFLGSRQCCQPWPKHVTNVRWSLSQGPLGMYVVPRLQSWCPWYVTVWDLCYFHSSRGNQSP